MLNLDEWLNSDGIKSKLGGFITPPKLPYRAYFDDYDAEGSDYHNLSKRHYVRIEVYNDADLDDYREGIRQSEAKTEALLDEQGFHYQKTSAAPLKEERMWMTIYEFTYLEVL